jgi:hypothetical protein
VDFVPPLHLAKGGHVPLLGTFAVPPRPPIATSLLFFSFFFFFFVLYIYIFHIFFLIENDMCRHFIGADIAPNRTRQMCNRISLEELNYFFGIP